MAFTGQLGTSDSRLGNFVLGFGSSAAPVFSAAIDGTIALPTMTSSFTFTAPVYSATIDGTVSLPTMVSAWTFVAPVYSATIDVSLELPTMDSRWFAVFNPVQVVAVTDDMYTGGY